MKNLEPKEVFSIFEQITQVPRPSKHEEQIIAYLLLFGSSYWARTSDLSVNSRALYQLS